MKVIVLAVSVVLFPTLARAAGPDPAKADVVMKCYTKDQPSHDCIVQCGTFQSGGSGGPGPARYVGVEKVEMYTHGKASAGYDRQWIILTQGGDPRPTKTAIYMAANLSCAFDMQTWNSYAPFVSTQLRIEKFEQ
jgi:hypothetical protein